MVQQQLTRILQDISTQLEQLLQTDHIPGLLGGHTGCALFYAYYYQLTGKEEYLEKVHEIILSSIDAIANTALPPSHCNGIAGITWTIQHLMNQGFVEGDIEEIFGEIDTVLGSKMIEDLQQQRYDFLHEGLGIALYFLEKDTPSPWLTQAADVLEATATRLQHGFSWEDRFTPLTHDEPCFNLGIAHGMPAIVSILSKIKGPSPVVEKSLDWILSVSNPPGTGSLYPTLVNTAGQPVTASHSRLGWCYGDLPIAMTMLHGGYAEQAHEILTHIANHRDVKNGMVHDTCLCHGSAGIAHAFNRAHRRTGDDLFRIGAEKWLQHTIDIYKSPAGLGFYNSDGNYTVSPSVLEGIAGVGLAVIAALDKDTDPVWDRCLLLS